MRYGIVDLVIETKSAIKVIEVQNTDLKNIQVRIKMYASWMYVKQNPGIDYEYARLFCLDSYSEKEVLEILEELKQKEKFKKIVKEIESLEQELSKS